jgi:signal transduction histidine kinase
MVPAQAQQLFQNLISNSLKFVRSNVQPVVKVMHRYLSENEVAHYNLRTANRYLELQITDNGIGFEEEFQEKIFAVFQRLHHKHEYEGTGIGLAICRKIVTSYGGSIMASGRTGEGATFTIIIPQ